LAHDTKENVDFIKPDMWPTNSPDLNPVNYAVSVCGVIEQRVYHRRKFNTVEELKKAWAKTIMFH